MAGNRTQPAWKAWKGILKAFVNRILVILPRRRPERGGTLRKYGHWEAEDKRAGRLPCRVTSGVAGEADDSDRVLLWNASQDPERIGLGSLPMPLQQIPRKPVPNQRVSTVNRRQTRRERSLLRQSGDYLGVQGANPRTGEPDAASQTSCSESRASEELVQQLYEIQLEAERPELSYQQEDLSYRRTVRAAEEERRELHLIRDRGKSLPRQEERERVVAHVEVRWKQHQRGWTSAQEPDLYIRITGDEHSLSLEQDVPAIVAAILCAEWGA